MVAVDIEGSNIITFGPKSGVVSAPTMRTVEAKLKAAIFAAKQKLKQVWFMYLHPCASDKLWELAMIVIQNLPAGMIAPFRRFFYLPRVTQLSPAKRLTGEKNFVNVPPVVAT